MNGSLLSDPASEAKQTNKGRVVKNEEFDLFLPVLNPLFLVKENPQIQRVDPLLLVKLIQHRISLHYNLGLLVLEQQLKLIKHQDFCFLVQQMKLMRNRVARVKGLELPFVWSGGPPKYANEAKGYTPFRVKQYR